MGRIRTSCSHPPVIYGKGVVWSFGFVLLHWPPLRMYLFGIAEGRKGPRAISKTMKGVLILLCC